MNKELNFSQQTAIDRDEVMIPHKGDDTHYPQTPEFAEVVMELSAIVCGSGSSECGNKN